MYELLRTGRLGNTLQQWTSYREMRESGYRGPWGVRSQLKCGDPIRYYYVDPSDTSRVLQEIVEKGYSLDVGLIWTAVIPSEETTIQGEIRRDVDGMYFRHTFNKQAMRVAFEHECLHATGLETLLLLRRYCNPQTIDELNVLLDMYPEHVIEFSAYSQPVGIYGKWHVIWEVRSY